MTHKLWEVGQKTFRDHSCLQAQHCWDHTGKLATPWRRTTHWANPQQRNHSGWGHTCAGWRSDRFHSPSRPCWLDSRKFPRSDTAEPLPPPQSSGETKAGCHSLRYIVFLWQGNKVILTCKSCVFVNEGCNSIQYRCCYFFKNSSPQAKIVVALN